MRRARYALEAALVYMLYYFFRCLPLSAASAIGGAIARTIGPHLPSSAVARKNLAEVFPQKTEQERKKILTGMWDNLGRVFAEYAHLDRIWERIEVVGAEHLTAAAQNTSTPTIFFTAHLANWETAPITLRQYGIEMHAVYRRPNNPAVGRLLERARKSGSKGLIAKGQEGARMMLSVLKKNGTLGIMMDQKMNEGVPIPFFGRDAMTAPAIASFARRFDCRVHPIQVERLTGTQFRLTIHPPVTVLRTNDKTEDMRAFLTEVNRQMEGWIRQHPEQWMWVHRRWPD